MKYVAGVALLLFALITASAVWANDESASSFYALSHVNLTQSHTTQLNMLSDVQLAKVEGSAWFPWVNDHVQQAQIREIVFQYFLASLLTDLFQGKSVHPTVPPASGQNNFLIQLNIAIGDHITQVNNAIQQNLLIINQRGF
jgi:hypothetical protein